MARKSNPWFQFKQFLVNQGNCAMKVTLDACLFGAVIDVTQSQRILDIGTGTGLLSLMAAQRCDAFIEAVELDADAVLQARHNFEQSPWSHRLSVIHCSVQNLPEKTDLYDTIICNPPFFENLLKAGNPQRRMARHTDSLGFGDLAEAISQKLATNGTAWILLPVASSALFLKHIHAKDALKLTQQVNIKPLEHKPDHRHVLVIEKTTEKMNDKVHTSNIIVRTDQNDYSSCAKELLSPYFLAL